MRTHPEHSDSQLHEITTKGAILYAPPIENTATANNACLQPGAYFGKCAPIDPATTANITCFQPRGLFKKTRTRREHSDSQQHMRSSRCGFDEAPFEHTAPANNAGFQTRRLP
jgi:hypothetical protein